MAHKSFPDDLRRLLPLTPAVFFVLFSLSGGAKHGYGIMQDATKLSDGKVRLGPGTLYSTLQRLLDLGLIEEVRARGGEEHDSRRRYYGLMSSGRTLLEAELSHMESVVRMARAKRLIPRASD